MKCKRCVLPESKPYIWLNEERICNICIDFEKRKKRPDRHLLEVEFYKILQKYRGKGKYDCLVMCSGGKDSTSALYYLKEKYRLNPLVFTFDHGFENEEAMRNIRNAVDTLGVDFLYLKTNFMKDVFREIITSKAKAPICYLCALWYIKLTYEIAVKFEIALIVAGWRKEQSKVTGDIPKEYKKMSRETVKFIESHLRKIPKYKDFPRSMKEAIIQAAKKEKIMAISPHWFLDKNPEELIGTLRKKLKWQPPKKSYPKDSTNCFMNYVNVYLSMKYFGYSHYHIEMSKQIREGEISRKEAIEKLKINFDKKFVNTILKDINCQIVDD